MNFRIIRKERIKGNGESQTDFIIQKKFLFWWLDYGIKTLSYTRTDWVRQIQKMVFLFDSELKAKEFLNKLKNPFFEKYKGEKIGVVFDERTWKEVYTNWSYSRSCVIGLGYEYSETLEGLKRLIDERKVKTKITVV